MAEGDAYTFDSFAPGDDTPLPAEDQAVKLRKFVIDFGQQLHDVREAVEAGMGEQGDAETDAVTFRVAPEEKLDIRQLIQTENNIFDKIMCAFAVLLDELAELGATAESTYFGPLSMFGEPMDSEQAPAGTEEDADVAMDDVDVVMQVSGARRGGPWEGRRRRAAGFFSSSDAWTSSCVAPGCPVSRVSRAALVVPSALVRRCAARRAAARVALL